MRSVFGGADPPPRIDWLDEEGYMTIAEELRAEGKIEGQIEGQIEGKICILDEQIADGLINRDYYEKTVVPLKQRLRELEAE